MNRKTNRVLAIIGAFIVNLGVYIGLIWSFVLVSKKLLPEPNFMFNFLMGFIVYSIFLKIKPFRVAKLLEKYSEEISEEHYKK